jgi:hypothetical protein
MGMGSEERRVEECGGEDIPLMVGDAESKPGSLRCVARHAETARKKRPGHSGRDDKALNR